MQYKIPSGLYSRGFSGYAKKNWPFFTFLSQQEDSFRLFKLFTAELQTKPNFSVYLLDRVVYLFPTQLKKTISISILISRVNNQELVIFPNLLPVKNDRDE